MRCPVVVVTIGIVLHTGLRAMAFPPPDNGPGGPILVISTAANPFSSYYAEILRAEGLNCFSVVDVAQMTQRVLVGYDVVILGEMGLSPTQAAMLNDWVVAGGNLIAMRPDPQLAGLLGITPIGSTLGSARPYIRVNANSGAGAGIVSQTIQFHGDADTYALNGATAVATLYSDATTPTSYPAVTMRDVGSAGGQAAAFTYDLARSVVYTRQGNPAWVGQQRDGRAPVRSYDLFFGPAAYDPQPDWVNLNKVAIPQADEQQRLLANMILTMNINRKPLPRFWYFPKNFKAVVVMTGDQHGCCSATRSRFQTYNNQSLPGCSVDDWECVRASSYVLYASSEMSTPEALMWTSRGFELGVHVYTQCLEYTPVSLSNAIDVQWANFLAVFSPLPLPNTNRTHCVVFNDYTTQPQVELSRGIRLDTNYYYYPPAWVAGRPGLFTGSGIPMRFATVAGQTIDCYQLPTQMTDESGQPYPFTCDTLLDRALGPEGYYAALCANMHTDYPVHPGSDAIVQSALSRGVPVISARQMLAWLDGRNGSNFGSIVWNNGMLFFSITPGVGARNLRAMLPWSVGTRTLMVLTRDGWPVQFTLETIKGITYAMFAADLGNYEAIYLTGSPPTGACCGATGACTVTTVGNCGGVFHSEWADCTQAACPQRGACCFGDGHCTFVLNDACAVQNGTFRGENTACTPGACPQPGACCFADGHCATLQAPDCSQQGGSFRGPGIPCTFNSCPQLAWSCCFADGTCRNMLQTNCAAQGGVWRPGVNCSTSQCPPPNLLVNPDAEVGDLSGWTVDAAGGSGWSASFDGLVHSGSHSFATSSDFCARHQLIDLIGAGYTPAQLDAAPPVRCSEWVGTRTDQGGKYFIRFELLDANQQIITYWEHGTQTAPIALPANAAFFAESRTFFNYGPGVRYVKFIDGGRDTGGLSGDFGVHFDDALVGLVPLGGCCQPGGSCVLTTQFACTRDWQGAWSDCASSPCGGGSLGDMNCDGDFDHSDLAAFVLALLDSGAFAQQYPGCNILNGDFNHDGRVDGGDIQRFSDVLP